MAITSFTKQQVDGLFINFSTPQSIVMGCFEKEELEGVHEALNIPRDLAINELFAKIWQMKGKSLLVVDTQNPVGNGKEGEVYKVEQEGLPLLACKVYTELPGPQYLTSYYKCLKNDENFRLIPIHPNINAYKGIAFDRSKDRFGSLFEFIDGESIAKEVVAKMEPAARLQYVKTIMLQMAKALQRLEQAQIAHCDVLETNTMVTKVQKAVLIDFDEAIWPSDRENIKLARAKITKRQLGNFYYNLLTNNIAIYPTRMTILTQLEAIGAPDSVIDLIIDIIRRDCSWDRIIQALEEG